MADAGETPGEMIVLQRRSNTPGVNPKNTDHNQKAPFLKTPIEGQIPTWPGDYELQLLTLTSPNREGYINLKAAWSDLNIYEDMFTDCLTANIQITDSVGLMESVPIIGEETIYIKVKTAGIERQREEEGEGPFAGSENEGLIDLKFRVIKISDLIRLNEGTLTYKLSMVSEEFIMNQKLKVKKTSLVPVTLDPPTQEVDVEDEIVENVKKSGFQIKRLGSNPGFETIASMPPVEGSIATTAPLNSPSAFSAAC